MSQKIKSESRINMRKLISLLLIFTLLVILPVNLNAETKDIRSAISIKVLHLGYFINENNDLYRNGDKKPTKVLSNVDRLNGQYAITKNNVLYSLEPNKIIKLKTNIKSFVSKNSNKEHKNYLIKTDDSLWETDLKYKNDIKLADNVKSIFQDIDLYYNDEIYFDSINLYGIDVNDRQTWPIIFNTFIIKKDNSLWGRGTNRNGELGLGNKKRYNKFTKLMTNVTDMVVAPTFGKTNKYFIIKSDKSLRTWTFGKKPQKLLSNIKKVKYDNNNYIFALNYKNELWDITVQKPTLYSNDVKDFALQNCQYFIKNDSSLWDCSDRSKPVKCLSNVKRFYVKSLSELYRSNPHNWATFKVIKKDNTLWTWGYNYYGSLGRGKSKYTIPKKVFSDVEKVTEFCVLTRNGKLYNHCNMGEDDGTNFEPKLVSENVDQVNETTNGLTVYYTKSNDNSIWFLRTDSNKNIRYFTPK